MAFAVGMVGAVGVLGFGASQLRDENLSLQQQINEATFKVCLALLIIIMDGRQQEIFLSALYLFC